MKLLKQYRIPILLNSKSIKILILFKR